MKENAQSTDHLKCVFLSSDTQTAGAVVQGPLSEISFNPNSNKTLRFQKHI